MEMQHGFAKNVVSFVQKRTAMTFPAISQVDAYWEGLRAGRLMPQRSDIDPRGMESALEHVFMLELVAPRVGRMRIAGSHLQEILGMEVRGMPLSAFFEPEVREKLGQVIERVCSTPLIAEFKVSSKTSIGHPALSGRLYLAPLGTQEDGVTRILGCLETHGSIGRAPRRFTIEQVKLRRIVETAGTAPNNTVPVGATPETGKEATAPRTAPQTAHVTAPVTAPPATPAAPTKPPMHFAEPTSEFAAAPKKTKVPYLRLVKSDS
jgi:hypothetical protein